MMPIEEDEEAIQQETLRGDYTPSQQPQPMQQAMSENRPESVSAVTQQQPKQVNLANPSPSKTATPTSKRGGGFDWARALYAAGGGNPGDIDKIRSAPQERADAELNNQLKTSQFQDLLDQKRLAQDALDPASQQSRAAQDRFTGKMRLLSQVPGMPQSIAAQLNAAADSAGNRNAAEIGRLDSTMDGLLGTVSKFGDAAAKRDMSQQNALLNERKTAAAELQARNTGANIYSQIGDRRADNDLRARQISEEERHHKALESAGTQKIDAKLQGNQDKLNTEMEGWNNAEQLLKKAMVAKGNVDVGPLATPVNKLRQYTPWPNKEFNDLQQNLGSVRNEIKLLKAGKAVTANEEKGLNEELANLEQLQDDPTFEQKLQGMIDRVHGYKERVVNRYQRKEGGETVDRSNTARDATKSGRSLTPGEGGSVADKAKAVLNNPNSSEKAKIGAQKWLDDHGF